MVTYVGLMSFTEEGMQTVKEATARRRCQGVCEEGRSQHSRTAPDCRRVRCQTDRAEVTS